MGLLSDVVEGFGELLGLDAAPAPPGAVPAASGLRWVTIAGRSVEIDGAGLVVRGLARDLVGVHVSKVGDYFRERRRLENPSKLCRAAERVPSTYPTKAVAWIGLMEANPAIVDLLEGLGGADLTTDRAVHRARLAGLKLTGGEAGIDVVVDYLDRPGVTAASLGSFAAALYALVPGEISEGTGKRKVVSKAARELAAAAAAESGKRPERSRPPGRRRPSWADLEARFPVMLDALASNPSWSGDGINPPEAAIRSALARADVARCKIAVEDELSRLGAKYRAAAAGLPWVDEENGKAARRSRRRAAADLPDAPF